MAPGTIQTTIFSFFCLISKLYANISTISMTENTDYQNSYTSYGALGDFNAKTLSRCVDKCLTSQCLSLFYNGMTNQCTTYDYQISSSVIAGLSINMVSVEGWRYYSKNEETVTSGKCDPYPGFVYNASLDVCYKVEPSITMDYDEVGKRCASQNSNLIKIDSPEKQAFVKDILASDTESRVCIQGNNDNPDNEFRFDNGTPMSFFNWNVQKSQPNGGTEHYIFMRKEYDYLWHDGWKSYGTRCTYICEI